MKPEYRIVVTAECLWWIATVYYGKKTVIGVTGMEKTAAAAILKGESIIIADKLGHPERAA